MRKFAFYLGISLMITMSPNLRADNSTDSTGDLATPNASTKPSTGNQDLSALKPACTNLKEEKVKKIKEQVKKAEDLQKNEIAAAEKYLDKEILDDQKLGTDLLADFEASSEKNKANVATISKYASFFRAVRKQGHNFAEYYDEQLVWHNATNVILKEIQPSIEKSLCPKKSDTTKAQVVTFSGRQILVVACLKEKSSRSKKYKSSHFITVDLFNTKDVETVDPQINFCRDEQEFRYKKLRRHYQVCTATSLISGKNIPYKGQMPMVNFPLEKGLGTWDGKRLQADDVLFSTTEQAWVVENGKQVIKEVTKNYTVQDLLKVDANLRDAKIEEIALIQVTKEIPACSVALKDDPSLKLKVKEKPKPQPKPEKVEDNATVKKVPEKDPKPKPEPKAEPKKDEQPKKDGNENSGDANTAK